MARVHKIPAHGPRDTQLHTMKVSVSHVVAICGILVAAASQSPVLSNGARALYPGLNYDSSNQVKFQDSPSNSVKFEDQSEPPVSQSSGYGSSGPQFEDMHQAQPPLHYDRSYKPVKFDSTGAGSMHMNLMHEPHHQVHHVQQQPTVHLVQPVHTVQQVHSVQPVHTVQTVQPVQTVQTVQPVQTVHVPRPVHPYSYVVDNAPANTLNTPVFAEHHLQDYRKPEHHKHLQKGVSPWRKVVRVLAAAIPIGLFLAALPPNVVHINATQHVKPLGTANMQVLRKSVDAEQSFPILDLIETLGGLSALRHPGCEAHVFCEMARLGSTPAANMVQRTLWSMANETPEEIVELLGAKELLTAVRKDACNTFECPRPVETESDPAVLQAVGQDLR